MKSCPRCGRNLDLTGHSLSCPLGTVLKKIEEGGGNEAIRIAFPNDEVKIEFGEMLMRTAQAMTATKTFFDALCELNEDAEDLDGRVAPHLEKFFTDLFLIYPSPAQFDADLDTLLGKATE